MKKNSFFDMINKRNILSSVYSPYFPQKSSQENYTKGTDGDDYFRGHGIYEGGKGDDVIYMADIGSSDTLIFNLGDGKDTIYSKDFLQAQDKVIFGQGITADMISFSRNRNDLIVTIGDNGDQMTFSNFFESNYSQTFTLFEFKDGTVWNDIRQTEAWKKTDLSYVIRGTDGDDILQGGGIFEGGKGNDTIIADKAGSKDTIRFNLGDGQDTITSEDWMQQQDTIVFGNGITADMIKFERVDQDLVVVVGDNGDQMTFRDFFIGKDHQTFTRFEFSDGVTWDNIFNTDTWKNSDLAPVIRGTDKNDVLNGGGIFEGGKGDDTIYVQNINSQDTLRFNLGDGKDTVYSRDWQKAQDKIVFGKDVTPDMISFRRNRNDLTVIVGDKGDEITFKNFFESEYNQTFSLFEFKSDGTVWNDIRLTDAWKNSDLENIIRGTDGNDRLSGSGIFEGGKGDDYIAVYGHSAKDTLRFNLGDGKDSIYVRDQSTIQDVVSFGKDVTADMIKFQRGGNDLIVIVGDQGDQMTFTNFFKAGGFQTFTRFEFTDGTVWEDIRQTDLWKNSDLTLVILGTDGNDILRGSGIFEGGKGDDTIYATVSGSQDTIRFNLGDGKDVISAWDNKHAQDKVVFGKDVTADMVSFSRSYDDLIVKIGNNGDQMTFKGFYESESRQTFTQFEFADGTVWQDIRDKLNTPAAKTVMFSTENNPCAVMNQANNLVSAIANFNSAQIDASFQSNQTHQLSATVLAASAV